MSLSSFEDDQSLSDAQSRDSCSSSSYDSDDGQSFPAPPPQQNHYFAPPFYGRPPTPLPPSPSLTSLLRPSRPTTPDASDDEIEPVPRASPKVPTYEYYGFVLYLFSSLSFLVYLLWSYLPSPFLHALGIYYYPNRWWSLAIPSFLVMSLVYVYVALAAYNTEILTAKPSAIETIVDDAAKVAVLDHRGRLVLKGATSAGQHQASQTTTAAQTSTGTATGRKQRQKERNGAGGGGGGGPRKGTGPSSAKWRNAWNEGTDAVMDIPLAGVCEVLYGGDRDSDDDITVE